MECGVPAAQVQPAVPMDQPGQPAKPPVQPWEYSLRKYLLLLAAMVVTIGDGATTSFWACSWLGGRPLKQAFPAVLTHSRR